jgi:hypothetical protein
MVIDEIKVKVNFDSSVVTDLIMIAYQIDEQERMINNMLVSLNRQKELLEKIAKQVKVEYDDRFVKSEIGKFEYYEGEWKNDK